MKFRIARNLRILKESIMARTTKKTADNPVVCCIVDLIRKRGKTEKDLTDYLGMAPGAMSKGSMMEVLFISST